MILVDVGVLVGALRTDSVHHDICRNLLEPSGRHRAIFADLCIRINAGGNLVPDAWLAALAIEHGCEWITLDRDFAQFPALQWRLLRSSGG